MTRAQFYAWYRAAETALHEQWGKAKADPGYHKRSWLALQNAFERMAWDMAFRFGLLRADQSLSDLTPSPMTAATPRRGGGRGT